MTDPLILSLEESRDPRLVGGKATGLRKLLAAGFAVPKGLCVTTAVYQYCLAAGGIDAEGAWRAVLSSSGEERREEQSRIQGCLLRQAWPAGFQADLESTLDGVD